MSVNYEIEKKAQERLHNEVLSKANNKNVVKAEELRYKLAMARIENKYYGKEIKL